MSAGKKTDNSFLQAKIDLRIRHLPEGHVRVLDCFAGTGKIWDGIRAQTGREIDVLPIDRRKDITRFRLPGDNSRFLKTLDLTKYNLIDLDAYGVPFDQVNTLFERKYVGCVHVTFIQTMMGGLPRGLTRAVGFSDNMAKLAPSLMAANGWSYWLQWMASHGVVKIHHIGEARKHYFTFNLSS